jgi:hypothetical protein
MEPENIAPRTSINIRAEINTIEDQISDLERKKRSLKLELRIVLENEQYKCRIDKASRGISIAIPDIGKQGSVMRDKLLKED